MKLPYVETVMQSIHIQVQLNIRQPKTLRPVKATRHIMSPHKEVHLMEFVIYSQVLRTI